MSLDYINQKKIRKSFGKIPLVTSLPNLVEVQKRSFDNFLQLRVSPENKQDIGLHAIFKSVFPINDYTERATVDYVSFDIGVPKYDVEECSQRGMTYGAPLLVNFRLIIWDIDKIKYKITDQFFSIFSMSNFWMKLYSIIFFKFILNYGIFRICTRRDDLKIFR